jgi:hypothetical protein
MPIFTPPMLIISSLHFRLSRLLIDAIDAICFHSFITPITPCFRLQHAAIFFDYDIFSSFTPFHFELPSHAIIAATLAPAVLLRYAMPPTLIAAAIFRRFIIFIDYFRHSSLSPMLPLVSMPLMPFDIYFAIFDITLPPLLLFSLISPLAFHFFHSLPHYWLPDAMRAVAIAAIAAYASVASR